MMMISKKQPMSDDVKQDSPTTDDRKPLLKCKGCKKLFKTTEDLERHSVLNCKNIKRSGSYSHYDNWEKYHQHRSDHANYIGSDMNSKEYFDQMLDSDSAFISINSDKTISQEKPEWYHMPDVSTPKTSDQTTEKEPPKPKPAYTCNQCSDSESSESSIDSDIAHRFDKMVDEAIPTGSDEDDIARVKAWVETNVIKERPNYHMPDVSTPILSDQTIPEEPLKLNEIYTCNECHHTFQNSLLLKRHNYFHQQKNYQCDNCHLGFKYKHNLNLHKQRKCTHRYNMIKPTKKIKSARPTGNS